MDSGARSTLLKQGALRTAYALVFQLYVWFQTPREPTLLMLMPYALIQLGIIAGLALAFACMGLRNLIQSMTWLPDRLTGVAMLCATAATAILVLVMRFFILVFLPLSG